MHKDADSDTATDEGSGARRRCLKAVAAAAAAGMTSGFSAGAAQAQTQARTQIQAARRYAVVSLVGDRLTVVYAGPVTGTSLDGNRHRVVLDPKGAMDQFTLAAVGKALETAGSANAALLGVAPSPLHEQPDRLIDGKNVALPGSLVDALEQNRTTHLVLVTKQRADANIPLLDTHLGVGKLRGLGYYIDMNADLRMVESGATGRGLLAPYVHLKLTLADARTGAVLNQRNCLAAQAYAVAESKTALDPWEVLTAEDKIARLRGLLESEVAREVPLLLAT